MATFSQLVLPTTRLSIGVLPRRRLKVELVLLIESQLWTPTQHASMFTAPTLMALSVIVRSGVLNKEIDQRGLFSFLTLCVLFDIIL